MTTGEAPRTEAGRAMVDYLADFDDPEEVKVRVQAIEREAASIATGYSVVGFVPEAAAAPPRPDVATSPLPRPDTRTLELIRDLQPQAVKYIRQYGFVFDKVGPLADDAAELDRWKVLAFSLYTDVVEASMAAERMLEGVAAPEGLSLDALRETLLTDEVLSSNLLVRDRIRDVLSGLSPSSGESGSPGEDQ